MKFQLEGEIKPIPSSSNYSITGIILLIGDFIGDLSSKGDGGYTYTPIPIEKQTVEALRETPSPNEEGLVSVLRHEPDPDAMSPPRPLPERMLKKRRLPRETPPGFEEWYTLYPRKVARKDAEDAFRHLMKTGVPMATLMAATKEYVRQTIDTEPKYMKHPASFLRNERWRDYAPSDKAEHHMSAEEIAAIAEKHRSGEYSDELVRKLESKYGVKILEKTDKDSEKAAFPSG